MDAGHVWNFTSWRAAARSFLAAGRAPHTIRWQDGWQPDEPDLFADLTPALTTPTAPAHVPSEFLKLAETVACHRDPLRWHLLYHLLWRLTHGERTLLGDAGDPLMRKILLMRQSIGRDIHKMHAFVRFRKTVLDGHDTYLAFHRPDHLIVRPASSFFYHRFKAQRWGILTPDESVCWDGKTLVFGAGMPASAAPQADELEHLWLTYYRAIFNPARIKTRMMKSEIPVRHWRTLPESAIIAELLAEAPARVEKMLHDMTATPSSGALRRQQQAKT